MIGENIYKLRRSKDLTLTELAERAHISKSYLSNIERNINQNPSINILEKIAAVLEVELQVVLAGASIDHEYVDQDLLDFAHILKEAGIQKEQLNEFRPLIDYIKWKSEINESKKG